VSEALLSVRNLSVHFDVAKGGGRKLRAVDGVSFDIAQGETLSLVGESGCGKTTTGRAVLRLVPATAGEVRYRNVDLLALSQESLRKYRRQMQIVFQDPYASLNPRRTVGTALVEAYSIHRIGHPSERREMARQLLARVGLDPDYVDRYPHQFSGGQRQRIGIARALTVQPRLIVCDEPVSALDVSVQAQVINLLSDLQAEYGLSYLFIAHDLSVVRQISHRVAVMYLGRIVELADAEQLFNRPLHPYTRALLASVPVPDPSQQQRFDAISGEMPSPLAPPPGCHFHPRCPRATAVCTAQQPPLLEVQTGHYTACHLWAANGTKNTPANGGELP
jgi:oligopeptide transport system ATP-binding protein